MVSTLIVAEAVAEAAAVFVEVAVSEAAAVAAAEVVSHLYIAARLREVFREAVRGVLVAPSSVWANQTVVDQVVAEQVYYQEIH